MASEYRLLMITDKNGYAYDRRARGLQKYSPDDFSVQILDWGKFCQHPDAAEECDVAFLLDYSLIRQVGSKIRGAVPLVTSFNADAKRRQEMWPHVAYFSDWVVAVSRERYEQRNGVLNCCFVPNGVDLSVFHPHTAIGSRPEKVVAYSSAKAQLDKATATWCETERLLKAVGIECDFRVGQRETKPLTAEEMADWYSGASWVLCTSRTEGTANTVLEGAACGCCPVTTPVGQFPSECAQTGNCILLDSTEPAAVVEKVLAQRAERSHMGAAAMLAVKKYHYAQHSRHYFELFRRMAQCKPPTRPYLYDERDIP